jgi:hypothetical protein
VNLLIHPQQHRDHDLAALFIDRLSLSAVHTPSSTHQVMSPYPLDTYRNKRFCRAKHVQNRVTTGATGVEPSIVASPAAASPVAPRIEIRL